MFARSQMFVGGMLFGFAALGIAPCFAQLTDGVMGGLNGASQRTIRGAEQPNKPKVAPPPVLPGTKTEPEPAAPTQSAAEMTPTDALFDAINRGDLPAARDAVNRGAELRAQNILGLTPLELSVDLGHNDISFMLLSMREADSASRDQARTGTELGRAGGQALFTATGPTASRGNRAIKVSAPASDDELVESPRIVSGNGGAPIPAAGFLGFDEGRGGR